MSEYFRDDPETLHKLNEKGMKPITYTEGHFEAMENKAVGYFEVSVSSEKMRQKGLKMLFEAAIRAVLKPSLVKKEKDCILM